MSSSVTSAAITAPFLAGDQRQHHVDRGRAAGAGEAVAVDLEQLLRRLDIRELLAEAVEVLPVDGAAMAVEQPCLGQDVGPVQTAPIETP